MLNVLSGVMVVIVFIGTTSLAEPTIMAVGETYTHAKYRVLANLEEVHE